jgi:ferredoxin
MAMRKIIEIDEEKCDGCGQCVLACAEGALEIVNGKAKVVSDVFCDGLGACIGECPQDALRIVEREAPEFDEEAVKAHLEAEGDDHPQESEADQHACGCPSAVPMLLRGGDVKAAQRPEHASHAELPPELSNWPVQWRLIQPASPFFKGADILLAADCVPFSYRDFHGRFMKGKPVVIGCPKLEDQREFLAKLTDLFKEADPRSVTVVMMEVPCCQGLTKLVAEAARASGRSMPVKQTVVGIKGDILKET